VVVREPAAPSQLKNRGDRLQVLRRERHGRLIVPALVKFRPRNREEAAEAVGRVAAGADVGAEGLTAMHVNMTVPPLDPGAPEFVLAGATVQVATLVVGDAPPVACDSLQVDQWALPASVAESSARACDRSRTARIEVVRVACATATRRAAVLWSRMGETIPTSPFRRISPRVGSGAGASEAPAEVSGSAVVVLMVGVSEVGQR
jgi:hypothetical protein